MARISRNPSGRADRSSAFSGKGKRGCAAFADSTITGSPVTGSRRVLPLSRSTGSERVCPLWQRRRRASRSSVTVWTGSPRSSGIASAVAGKKPHAGRPPASHSVQQPPRNVPAASTAGNARKLRLPQASTVQHMTVPSSTAAPRRHGSTASASRAYAPPSAADSSARPQCSRVRVSRAPSKSESRSTQPFSRNHAPPFTVMVSPRDTV